MLDVGCGIGGSAFYMANVSIVIYRDILYVLVYF